MQNQWQQNMFGAARQDVVPTIGAGLTLNPNGDIRVSVEKTSSTGWKSQEKTYISHSEIGGLEFGMSRESTISSPDGHFRISFSSIRSQTGRENHDSIIVSEIGGREHPLTNSDLKDPYILKNVTAALGLVSSDIRNNAVQHIKNSTGFEISKDGIQDLSRITGITPRADKLKFETESQLNGTPVVSQLELFDDGSVKGKANFKGGSKPLINFKITASGATPNLDLNLSGHKVKIQDSPNIAVNYNPSVQYQYGNPAVQRSSFEPIQKSVNGTQTGQRLENTGQPTAAQIAMKTASQGVGAAILDKPNNMQPK